MMSLICLFPRRPLTDRSPFPITPHSDSIYFRFSSNPSFPPFFSLAVLPDKKEIEHAMLNNFIEIIETKRGDE